MLSGLSHLHNLWAGENQNPALCSKRKYHKNSWEEESGEAPWA